MDKQAPDALQPVESSEREQPEHSCCELQCEQILLKTERERRHRQTNSKEVDFLFQEAGPNMSASASMHTLKPNRRQHVDSATNCLGWGVPP